MPTIITHAAIPLTLGIGLGTKIIPPRLLLAGIAISMLPDADVLAFKFGVAYGHAFGHRGFTHSLLFAFALPTLLLAFYRLFNTSLTRIWLFLFVSLLSHSVLDSLTTGGKGVGWLWPWSSERFFLPWQVIKVAPFQLAKYATPAGHAVIISELLWVWLPATLLMLLLILSRKSFGAKTSMRN
ncbi:metal-dependent hydrolase [Yersinia pseudotuberculosis]|uniref:metal-dependent hydrolase n=1 Tax=Yersinia pseudotuberculosis TaxID=633 RepID=UPI0005DCF267|nr:metal-dependent hydrolase [Yersinia pseudotuberculosis]BCU89761.1 membrane protein [Yersinia pseudotuberculosis]CNK97535.1 metal-dependent hydrolase%2C membrane-bound [Yersinia pseudotuberculosis]